MTTLLTYEEVAERLHVTVRTVRRLVAAGQLRPVRVSRKPLITEREFEAFIAASFRRAA